MRVQDLKRLFKIGRQLMFRDDEDASPLLLAMATPGSTYMEACTHTHTHTHIYTTLMYIQNIYLD